MTTHPQSRTKNPKIGTVTKCMAWSMLAGFLVTGGPAMASADASPPLLSLEFEGTLVGSDSETPFKAINVEYFPAPGGQGVRVMDGGALEYGIEDNIDPSGGMVDIWLQKKWDNSFLSHFIFLAGIQGDNVVELNKDQNHYLRFLTCSNGSFAGVSWSTSGWEMDSWHHIQGYWNENGVYLYVDGEFVGMNDRGGSYQPPARLDATIRIGSYSEVGALWSDMVIDSVTVYGPGAEPPPGPTPVPTETPIVVPTETPTVTPTPTDTPPSFEVFAHIEPPEPKTLDDLECLAEVMDFEGYPGFDFSYRWFRDGEELTEPVMVGDEVLEATSSVLSHHFTTKNQALHCVVRATAWETGGTVFAEAGTAPVAIRNSTPTAPVVEIRPPEPVPGEDLGINIVTYSTDPDGDEVDYRIEWYESEDGGETWIFKTELTDLAFISGIYMQEGDLWRVVVTPYEVPAAKPESAAAVEEGEPGWDQVYIGYNSDPVVTVGFEQAGNVVAMPDARILWSAVDPDGGPVTVDLFYDTDGTEGGSILIASGLDAAGSIDWVAPASGKGMPGLDLSGDGSIGPDDLFLFAKRWEADPPGPGYRIFARAYDANGAMGEAFSEGSVIVPDEMPCDAGSLADLRRQWRTGTP
jgi:hypothetical protein